MSNRRTGLAIVCPVTTTDRRFPFHVPIPAGAGASGFVMAEQAKSVDFRARGASRIGKAPIGLLEEVLAILDACLY